LAEHGYTGYHLQRQDSNFNTKRIFGDGSKEGTIGWGRALGDNLKNLQVIQLPKGLDPVDAGSDWSTHMINIGSMVPGLGGTQKVAQAVPGIYLVVQYRYLGMDYTLAKTVAEEYTRRDMAELTHEHRAQTFFEAQRHFAKDVQYVVKNHEALQRVPDLPAYLEKEFGRQKKLLLFCTDADSMQYMSHVQARKLLDAVLEKTNVLPNNLKFDYPKGNFETSVHQYFDVKSSRPFVHENLPYRTLLWNVGMDHWMPSSQNLLKAAKVEKTGTMQVRNLLFNPDWKDKDVTVYNFRPDGQLELTVRPDELRTDAQKRSLSGQVVMVGDFSHRARLQGVAAEETQKILDLVFGEAAPKRIKTK
jgi:hypothetical protein